MKQPLSFALFFAVLCVLAFAARAGGQSGFSVVTGSSLWTYETLDPLTAGVVPLPLDNQKAVSAAGSTLGGFVAVGTSAVAAFKGTNFTLATDFTGYSLSDVAYVSNTEVVVAVGVELGVAGNSVAFFQSQDSGVTWANPQIPASTELNTASISFSSGLGVAGFGSTTTSGSLIYRSVDGGNTWASAYSATVQTVSKVAVCNSSLSLATGLDLGSPFGLVSTNTAQTWSTLTLPTFAPTSAAVTGIAFVSCDSWLLTTSGGEIWQASLTTVNASAAAPDWQRTFSASNISWTDVAYSSTLHALLAAGSYTGGSADGVIAVSSDDGSAWTTSAPQPGASFVRVVPAVPVAAASPSPSPSVTPSPSASPSASTVPAVSASSSPSSSPSASLTPSTSPTPSPSPSTGASRTPSASPTPSASASPSQQSATPSASASPSTGSSRTPSSSPSASPSKGSSPTPSVTPSPSPSPRVKESTDDTKTFAFGLGVGIAAGAVILGGFVGLFIYRRSAAKRSAYQPISNAV